ncbi:MAG: fumarate reductase cytochrome b subunit [Burkholderiales bacterium]|nr:fumarate reductase cytochrome b subunit [Burkholderiales bacterium]
MTPNADVIAGVGLKERPRKSRWPARMDVAQSVSGLLLGLFMWGHMFFVSSILVSEKFMWTITKMFEGYFFFGKPYPIIVSGVVAVIIILFVMHALLALRKFPANYRQYQAFSAHRKLFGHTDTTLWWLQFLTGFALFFLASPHLFQMLVHPGLIGPFESSDRVWSGGWWPLYLILLFVVELHGGIGLYRLAVKWGWLSGADADASRRRLQRAKWALTIFFLVLGLATLAAYMKIGYAHRDKVGELYVPPAQQQEVGK